MVLLALPEPGGYRAFVGFAVGGHPLTLGADLTAVGGHPLTLGADLTAPGYYEPKPPPAPTGVARSDGYEVMLDAEMTAAGQPLQRFSWLLRQRTATTASEETPCILRAVPASSTFTHHQQLAMALSQAVLLFGMSRSAASTVSLHQSSK